MWRLPGRHLGRFGRQLRSQHALAGLKEGSEVEGFEVTQVTRVPELFLDPVVRLEHKGTGAQYLHLARADDNNNAFAVAFRTSPRDSTGLPHILEHVTLCGSKRYPVRDPFFKMLNRSLASFMNAMTGPDFTVYPFSSPNQKDFHQLLSIYLDAVFKPLLRDMDFSQEGWRLEHEVVGDPNSPLVLRGVVFNEMKGCFADPQARLQQDLLSHLLPSDTYAHVFGGEPLCIPALTAQDLRNFHAQCYHPSNARIVSYGNFPLGETLQRLQEEQLAGFTKQTPVASVPREKRWTEPKRVHVTCTPDPLGAATNPEKQSTLAMAYLCGDATNVYETFTLQVLSELLLGGPTSVLHRALIEPGIGDGFAPCTYFEAQTRDTFFSVGLQGVAEKQFDEIQDVTKNALLSARDKGFDSEHIKAILHSMEIGAKTQSANFGLNMALGILPSWNHGADPVECLNLSANVARLRKQLENEPKFLQNLLDQYLCSNPHVLTITMSPDEGHSEKLVQAESKILSDKVSVLDDSAKDRVLELEIGLQKEQMKPSDTSCLPTLSMSDLNPEPQKYICNKTKMGKKEIPVHIFPQPTNGVTHFRALLDTSRINPQLRDTYLPLFLAVATRMGTKKNDYRQFDRKIQLCTSGLGMGSHIIEHPTLNGQFLDSILLSSNCLDRNLGKMMDLWKELLLEPSFTDRERLETLVRATAAEVANGVAYGGHRYAMLNASSRLTTAGSNREKDSGLTFISQMKQFASMEKEEMENTLNKLQELSSILYESGLRCSVNVSPGETDSALKQLESDLISSLPNPAFNNMYRKNELIQDAGTKSSQHHVLPLPVGYLGRSIATGVPYLHPDFASLRVAGQLLSAQYLHSEVRERGGAYGSGAVMNASGNFSYYSYRDPEASRNTPNVFNNSASWLLNPDNYKAEHVDEAKLSIFQKVDAPTAPGDRGMSLFLSGVDLEMLQRHRQAVKSVRVEDVLRVAAKYLDQRENPLTMASSLIGPPSSDLDDSWEVLNG
ncbi:presequence protease, mitochondrial [Neocloeon triangulifer]|uniref:presequence protease, mitochondrial n=1 Tax=Neocloeon triangulifer TaxID=2078957 RepID=UPI00286F49CA|nr:presequence protease, mitochondrial [Neocloeon triangulifer]